MKKFTEMDYTEQKETAELFATWLRPYTHEVIVSVLARRDEILASESSMHLLRELHEREAAERKEFDGSIRSLLASFSAFAEFDPHNHALSHAGSYRDVLYDLYIR